MTGPASETWFVRIHDEMLAAEDLLRVAEFAKVARETPYTWIKLELTSPESGAHKAVQATTLAQLVATLPGERWLVEGDALVRPGRQVPERIKPDLKWKGVEDLLRIQLPQFQVAARIIPQQRVPLQLVRGGDVVRCEGLLTTVSALTNWVQYAPEARLKELRWVIKPLQGGEPAGDSKFVQCIVLGERLPPVEGTPLVANQKVLTPAGFRWEPAVSVTDLRQAFKVNESEWLLWTNSETYSTMEDDLFATMTRASVRHLLSSTMSHSNSMSDSNTGAIKTT